MLRTLSLILSVLLCTALQAGQPNKVLHRKCIYPTVMVVNKSPATELHGSGTGVIVKSRRMACGRWENFVLTVAHAIRITPEMDMLIDGVPCTILPQYDYVVRVGIWTNWSTLRKIEEYWCQVLYEDDEDDVALLRFVSRRKMPVAEMGDSENIFIGNEAIRVGCGLGEPFRLDRGMITSLPWSQGRKRDLAGCYRISVPTIQGDSGGPVYHENKVIALAQAIAMYQDGPNRSPVPHIAYAVSIETFLDHQEIVWHLEDE